MKSNSLNSLEYKKPELAAQWHPIRNNSLTPSDVSFGSDKKVWWQCSKDPTHEWETRISNRTSNGRGCPYCANQKASKSNNLAAIFPDLAKEWHSTKNAPLTPADVLPGSKKKIWWQCPREADHVWEGAISGRSKGNGCPFCVNKRLAKSNSLLVKYPELTKEWHPTKNGRSTPDKVVAGGETKYWWQCSKSTDHEWISSIYNRIQGSGCPYCTNRHITKFNSLLFKNPFLAKEWHSTKTAHLHHRMSYQDLITKLGGSAQQIQHTYGKLELIIEIVEAVVLFA